jgi:hypothetical protein
MAVDARKHLDAPIQSRIDRTLLDKSPDHHQPAQAICA